MDYFVVGPDGQEYGPANVDTLRSWAQENRIGPTTMLKDFQTGQVLPASNVSGIFPPQQMAPPPVARPPMGGSPHPPGGNWSQPPNHYARPGQQTAYRQDTGNMDIVWALVRSSLAIVFVFLFNYVGLITAIYSVIWAFRAKEKGHKHAPIAIGISIAVLIFVLIMFAIRLTTGTRAPGY